VLAGFAEQELLNRIAHDLIALAGDPAIGCLGEATSWPPFRIPPAGMTSDFNGGCEGLAPSRRRPL
jgi:hypothetical protein